MSSTTKPLAVVTCIKPLSHVWCQNLSKPAANKVQRELHIFSSPQTRVKKGESIQTILTPPITAIKNLTGGGLIYDID
ncbi:hypothetical protein M378DRAFT_162930 [Amanita muscaria Koide BX008]|uniref:Uncharacterized protein n=1 Tax=Amanita muscaria (strain Koide BX008) TaxID=946122 RepID=A0A0C2SNF9_AMAMK|nr:hypothetical protein M378DRAFT_162930 [Amanita muscaria Koide BX008]